MDLNHLDSIARAIAAGRTRRRLLGALTGGLVGLVSLPTNLGSEVEAAKPKSRKKRKPKRAACPKKRRCGKKCCRGATVCRRGVCRKRNPAKPNQTNEPPPTTDPPPDPDPEPEPEPEPEPGRVLVRRSVHDLDPNGPEMQALARGIAVMKSRPESDPTSWLGQANVHLNAMHGNVHFLSWHRMYLYWFERILRKAAGDDTLTLPYWDYSVSGQRILPAPFLDQNSSLYTEHRSSAVNDGVPPAPDPFRMNGVMESPAFMHLGTGTSFGGSPTAPGLLEQRPHNPIHNWVGGTSGYMRNTRESPKDPLFWLHHCNIDRLWEEWLSLGGGRANTSDPQFLNASFRFYDEDGNPVQMTGSQVLDTAGQLGYRYDGYAAGRSSMSAMGRRRPTLLPASKHASQVVAATPQSKPVTLTRSTVKVAIPRSKKANAIGGAGKAAKPRATLTLKHVAGTGVHGVIFNVSVRGGNKQADLGPLSLFGAQPDDHHGHGSGDMSFDISNVLAAAGNKNLTVTFEPVDVTGAGLPGGALATIDRLVITVQGAKKKQAKKTKQQRKKARVAKKAGRQKQKQKQQRPSGNTRKRTANPKQKSRQSSVSHGNHAAAVPGNKSSSVFTLPGTGIEDDAAMDTSHAHH